MNQCSEFSTSSGHIPLVIERQNMYKLLRKLKTNLHSVIRQACYGDCFAQTGEILLCLEILV